MLPQTGILTALLGFQGILATRDYARVEGLKGIHRWANSTTPQQAAGSPETSPFVHSNGGNQLGSDNTAESKPHNPAVETPAAATGAVAASSPSPRPLARPLPVVAGPANGDKTAAPPPAVITPSSPSPSPPAPPHGPSNITSGTGALRLTTLTVNMTSVHTVTSCAASVTNCPARNNSAALLTMPPEQLRTSLVTVVIDITTTVCPVAQASGLSRSLAAAFTRGVIMGNVHTVTAALSSAVPAHPFPSPPAFASPAAPPALLPSPSAGSPVIFPGNAPGAHSPPSPPESPAKSPGGSPAKPPAGSPLITVVTVTLDSGAEAITTVTLAAGAGAGAAQAGPNAPRPPQGNPIVSYVTVTVGSGPDATAVAAPITITGADAASASPPAQGIHTAVPPGDANTYITVTVTETETVTVSAAAWTTVVPAGPGGVKTCSIPSGCMLSCPTLAPPFPHRNSTLPSAGKPVVLGGERFRGQGRRHYA